MPVVLLQNFSTWNDYLFMLKCNAEKMSQNSLAFYNEDKTIIIDCNEKFSSTGPFFLSSSSNFPFWSSKDADSRRNSCPSLDQAVLLIL